MKSHPMIKSVSSDQHETSEILGAGRPITDGRTGLPLRREDVGQVRPRAPLTSGPIATRIAEVVMASGRKKNSTVAGSAEWIERVISGYYMPIADARGVIERLANEVEHGGSSGTAIAAMLENARALLAKQTA